MYDKGVDLVVVNYRTPQLIRGFLESYVFQTSTVDTSLTIVDVDPTEQTRYEMSDILVSYRDQGIAYWPTDTNVGYSGACNFASTLGNREVVAFFNSDTTLYSDTLDLCYEALMADDDVAICGPLQVNSRGRVTNAGIYGTNEKPTMPWWQGSMMSSYQQYRDDCVSVMGSAYFIKRSVWDELANDPIFLDMYPDAEGAFLPTKHFYEETWCSYFARHKGYKIAHVGAAMMTHEWHQSSKLGDVEGQIMNDSRAMFRAACDRMGIARD